jgi:hypothetical protein
MARTLIVGLDVEVSVSKKLGNKGGSQSDDRRKKNEVMEVVKVKAVALTFTQTQLSLYLMNDISDDKEAIITSFRVEREINARLSKTSHDLKRERVVCSIMLTLKTT